MPPVPCLFLPASGGCQRVGRTAPVSAKSRQGEETFGTGTSRGCRTALKARRRARGEGRRAPAAMTVPIAKSFYDLNATSLQGEKVDFNVFRGRVVLIENVASL